MAVEFQRCGSLVIDQERELDRSDQLAILDVLGEPIFLEKDITLQELLRCLNPWHETVKRITGVNVTAILKRMEAKSEGVRPPREEITEVTLRPVAHAFDRHACSSSTLEIVWNAEARYKNPVGFGILAEQTTYLTCVPAWFLRDAKIALVEDCISANILQELGGFTVHNVDASLGKRHVRLIPRVSDSILFGLLCNLI
jgi:hypothetical protein